MEVVCVFKMSWTNLVIGNIYTVIDYEKCEICGRGAYQLAELPFGGFGCNTGHEVYEFPKGHVWYAARCFRPISSIGKEQSEDRWDTVIREEPYPVLNKLENLKTKITMKGTQKLTPEQRKVQASKGGKALFAQRGREYFSEIGKRGGAQSVVNKKRGKIFKLVDPPYNVERPESPTLMI